MSECGDWEEMIDRSGDPAFDDDEANALLAHVDGCRSCAGLFDLVGRMRADDVVPEPGDVELERMRRKVMRAISRENGESSWASAMAYFRVVMARPAIALPSLAAMLIVGLVAGRFIASVQAPAATRPAAAVASGPDGAIASEIRLVAANSRDLEDVENSPFSYSNVQVRDSKGGRVALSFDVSRHLDLELDRGDPLLTDVLVQSLLEPSGAPTRLKAMDYASTVGDPRVRDALIRSMLSDPDLIVRMESQTRLIQNESDEEVTKALLTVLEKESSVQMRLVAIDYLTRSRVAPAVLEKAIDAGPEGRAAVFVRARDYLSSQ